jgi:hypothetical protein
VRAPSVHNTQPWCWRVGDRTAHCTVTNTLADPPLLEVVIGEHGGE